LIPTAKHKFTYFSLPTRQQLTKNIIPRISAQLLIEYQTIALSYTHLENYSDFQAKHAVGALNSRNLCN